MKHLQKFESFDSYEMTNEEFLGKLIKNIGSKISGMFKGIGAGVVKKAKKHAEDFLKSDEAKEIIDKMSDEEKKALSNVGTDAKVTEDEIEEEVGAIEESFALFEKLSRRNQYGSLNESQMNQLITEKMNILNKVGNFVMKKLRIPLAASGAVTGLVMGLFNYFKGLGLMTAGLKAGSAGATAFFGPIGFAIAAVSLLVLVAPIIQKGLKGEY